MSGCRYILILFSFFFINLTDQARASSCSCLPLPVEGSYSGVEKPFTITYLDDGAGTFGADDEAPACPTQMQIQSKRIKGPELDTVLTCDPATNEWVGIEQTGWMAKNSFIPLQFGWKLRGTSSGSADPHAKGLPASTETVEFDLEIPKIAKAAGKSDRKGVKLKLAGNGVAPPCLCQAVRLEYAHVTEMRDAYGDKKHISDAEYAGIRGTNSNEDFWLDDTGTLQSLPQSLSALTYQVRIENLVVPPDSAPTHAQKIRSKNEAAKVKASERTTALSGNAFASVNPGSCKITPPDKKAAIKECLPGIVVSAAMKHEQVHKDRCEALNKKFPEYKYNGKQINWAEKAKESKVGTVLVQGSSGQISGPIGLPMNAYVAWSQKPGNHARDEFEAYSVEADMLKAWLGKFCSG